MLYTTNYLGRMKDGMLGKEALVILTNLSLLMAEKLKEPISHVHGWVNR